MKLQLFVLLALVGILIFGCAAKGEKPAGSTSTTGGAANQAEITESDLSEIDDPQLGDDLEANDLTVE